MRITTETGSVYEIVGKTLSKRTVPGPFTRTFVWMYPEVPEVGKSVIFTYANGQTLRTSRITYVVRDDALVAR